MDVIKEDVSMLQEFLSLDEISQIDFATQKKIDKFVKSKIDELVTAKAVFEINRKNYEQKSSDLTKYYQSQCGFIKETQNKLHLAENYSTELLNQLTESKKDLSKLQDTISRLESDRSELNKFKNSLSDENYTLHLQIKRKDSEVKRLQIELESLSLQLQTAISSKCQALTEFEEIKSREISLDFREKRLEQEKILLNQQISSLDEELLKRTNELKSTRLEASSRALLVSTRLNQCEEELRIANETVLQVRESNSILQLRSEELTQKLEDQQNHELTMHSSYREEVMAQTRLAELYKCMADEANAKANDYCNAVEELQNLLEHATEQYGALESKHNQILSNHDNEMLNQQKKIQELSEQLELANELLQSVKQERLDKAIEELAPTAAMASTILRKGSTLTQIYTDLINSTNELMLEKQENQKLKDQMEIILVELEEKAPLLNQQKEDYEAAITNIATLSLRIEDLKVENIRLSEENDEAKRLANHHSKETKRLKSELADLARQVCYLLKEVQESKSGSAMCTDNKQTIDLVNFDSTDIISKKLVTFRNIENLQENNQKLLSIVRTLSSRQEEIERATNQINSGAMKEKLERYIKQLSEMQEAQNRQSKMLESLLKQRNMYKSMYQQSINQHRKLINPENIQLPDTENVGKNCVIKELNSSQNTTDYDIKMWIDKAKNSEAKVIEIRHDFETYKKENATNEKMLNEEIDRLRKESEKNSDLCCRLKAQLDSANERCNLLYGNVGTYKSQIKILEEKCNIYNLTIGKHEQSLMLLKDEALTVQSYLSKAEVQLEHLKQEKQFLQDSEERLLKERDVFLRERQTHALLKADVESIKASLEREQAEGQIRTEQRLDDANRECSALRRRLQEEQDRFRNVSTSLEQQISTVQEKLNAERQFSDKLKTELALSRTSETNYIKKIEDLNSKLKKVSTNTIIGQTTVEDVSNKKLKDLKIKLLNSQQEIKFLTDQLKTAHFQSQQYCDIAESAELQLKESTGNFQDSKHQFDLIFNSAQEEIKVLNSNIRKLEEKLKMSSNGQNENNLQMKEMLDTANQKLESFEELKIELDSVKKDLQNTSIAMNTAEEKYAQEMILHSSDLQMLSKLKEENQFLKATVDKLAEQKRLDEEVLSDQKLMWQEREKCYNEEIKDFKIKLSELDKQNNILHNQIQDFSERSAIMYSQYGNSSSIVNIDLNNMNEKIPKSTDQLLQIFKYLRREKDLAFAKYDVLKSENVRLKSQAELAEKKLYDLKKLLEEKRENIEIDVVTVTKHTELLRKVETLNAITDSNRVLRKEKDSLYNKIKDLTSELNITSDELMPLREKTRILEAKVESVTQENNNLKNEATRWRQRANTLLEKANKASPEDWRRLQMERENLSKLLTTEREVHKKQLDELNSLKSEKLKMEENMSQLKRQIQLQEEILSKIKNDTQKVTYELNSSLADLNIKSNDIDTLRKEIVEKDAMLVEAKNKEIQIRKIAKKYKTQYEELTKNLDEKNRLDNSQNVQTFKSSTTGSYPKEEEHSDSQNANVELLSKVDELRQKMSVVQAESENLKKEIEVINKASLEKEERAKQVLKGARTKIMQLTEYKKSCEKEIKELKEQYDLTSREYKSSINEYEAKFVSLKTQMEGRISRLEHERSDMQAEKEVLLQRATQLQRLFSGQSNINIGINEPPTANIKPMSLRSETPLASIRPMSVVVQSRTAAVIPTAGAPLHLVPQQAQQVHTTETSSPTSSHIDYQPVSTSRQLLVPPQLNESAEATVETDIHEILSTQQQSQQQTIALISPRIEQQQSTVSDQQQIIPSSSTQSVTTSNTCNNHKRSRNIDSLESGSIHNDKLEHERQDDILSPKTKRCKQQDLVNQQTINISDVEYQVPTSSQRDQDEDESDNCAVVDCDEGSNTLQPQEEDEFENDPYEEIAELPFTEEAEGHNNEVEIIVQDTISENVEQIQSEILNNQQQSEAISSVEPPNEHNPFTLRSRNSTPTQRQQPQQHLLLQQQNYEDIGDDCIVPSTPTLCISKRSDGFSDAMSSPQVPQRFTFSETSTSSSQLRATSSVSETRLNFGSSTLAEVAQEGMDDTRVDLSQLEDKSPEHNILTITREISPASNETSSVTILQSQHDHSSLAFSDSLIVDFKSNNLMTIQNAGETNIVPANNQPQIPTYPKSETALNESCQTVGHTRDSDSILDEHNSSQADLIEVSEEGRGEQSEGQTKENNEADASPLNYIKLRSAGLVSDRITDTSRGVSTRRSARTAYRTIRGSRPTPIVWDHQSSERGQSHMRGHMIRRSSNEGTRIRGVRGRRIRSKYSGDH